MTNTRSAYSHFVGCHKFSLETPALLLDLDTVERNLCRMADFCASVPVGLRPHLKTAKLPVLAHWQLRAGAIGICTASLGEAEVMIQAGIRDVLVTREIVQPGEIRRAVALNRHADLTVIVDDADVVDLFSQAATAAGVTVRVLVDVDVRLGRSGVPPGEPALQLARHIDRSPGLSFTGLMGYEGSMHNLDAAERERQGRASLDKLVATRRLIEAAGLPVAVVSAGASSTYKLAGAYPGVTEIQPGSYLTGDLKNRRTQPDFEVALSVLTTVVSRPNTTRVTTDAGHKKLSSEAGLPQPRDADGLTLTALNEEHGLLDLGAGRRVRVGDKLEILPSQAGTTINLYDYVYGIRGEHVAAVWPIAARGA